LRRLTSAKVKPSEFRSGNEFSDDTRYFLPLGAIPILVICQYLRRWLQAFHELCPDCQSAFYKWAVILLTISNLANKFYVAVRHLNVIRNNASKFDQCHIKIPLLISGPNTVSLRLLSALHDI
jgi:hypothetical protein